jgi:hypothetical protein
MALRYARLPIIACACLLAGVVVGLVLAPANAQQMSPVDGQVAVRSDYAVYLIANGQRRWIVPVLITDDEINAYPEAEPVYSGVAPLPPSAAPASAPAAPASPAASPAPPPQPAVPPTPVPAPVPAAPGAAPAPAPAPAVPPAGAAPAGAAPAGSVASAPTGPVAYPTPNGATGEMDPLLPIEVDIDGKAIFEHGNEITVVIKSKTSASCELTVRWPDASETAQQPMTADARGRCSFKIRVPSSVPNGLGLMKGTVREGGRVSNQAVEFEIVPNVP